MKNLVKFKKLDIAKYKSLKTRNLDFAKTNFFGIDFLSSRLKKSLFTYKKPLLKYYYLDLEYYIQIKIDVYGFAISRILNKFILNKSFSNDITNKKLNFFEFKIS